MKLFASDLDGTLLNEKHESDQRILRGIQSVFDSGNIFTVCTGRNPTLTDFSGIFGTYRICMNGSLIQDPKGEILKKHPIAKEAIEYLLYKTEFPFEYQTIDQTYTTLSKQEYDEVFSKSMWMQVHKNDSKRFNFHSNFCFGTAKEEILKKEILKINMHHTDQVEKEAFLKLCKMMQEYILDAPSYPNAAEITATGISKATAVQELADFLHIKEKDIYVYGDGLNDLQMLKQFSNSFCPSNGSKEAKQSAKQIIGPNTEYAVVEHMLQMCS